MQAKWTVTVAATALLLSASAGANAQQQYQQWQSQQQQGQTQRSGQQGIEQEARNFFQQAEQTLNRAVQQGDENAIREWTQNHISDTASLSMLMNMSGMGRTPTGMRAVVVDKQELLRRQSAAFSLMPELLNAVNNYDINIRVLNVETIGNNAAIVRTRISESGRIGRSQATAYGGDRSEQQRSQQSSLFGQSGQQDQGTAATGAGTGQQGMGGQRGSGRTMSFNGVAECTQLVHRDQSGGRMTVGLSNCSAEMSF